MRTYCINSAYTMVRIRSAKNITSMEFHLLTCICNACNILNPFFFVVTLPISLSITVLHILKHGENSGRCGLSLLLRYHKYIL